MALAEEEENIPQRQGVAEHSGSKPSGVSDAAPQPSGRWSPPRKVPGDSKLKSSVKTLVLSGFCQSPGGARPSLKWLKLARGSELNIFQDATEVLKSYDGLVNGVMVCGRLRIGKSYLLNSLAGETGCFEVSSQVNSLTIGVDICPQLLLPQRFGAPADAPRIALLDLEGTGEKGRAQDAKIATPPLLISKVVILCETCPTGPASEFLLESLQVMMVAARFVSKRADRRRIFGHLHIVLRDCPQDEEECCKIIFDKEDPNVVETDEHAHAILMRNQVRDDICLAFEGRPRVWCLPKLPTDAAPLDYRDAPIAFSRKVDEMRQCLGLQLASPKELNGQPLTGVAIAALMPEVAEALRSDAVELNPPSLMDRVAESLGLRAAEEIVAQGLQTLHRLEEQLPSKPELLRRKVAELQGGLREALEQRLQMHLVASRGVECATVALDRALGPRAEMLFARNEELLRHRSRSQMMVLPLLIFSSLFFPALQVLCPGLPTAVSALGSLMCSGGPPLYAPGGAVCDMLRSRLYDAELPLNDTVDIEAESEVTLSGAMAETETKAEAEERVQSAELELRADFDRQYWSQKDTNGRHTVGIGLGVISLLAAVRRFR